MEEPEIYVNVHDALAKASKEKKRIYNLKPNRTAVFTVHEFFQQEVKIIKTQHTEYVCIKCVFHECDGKKINRQVFNLQVSLLNGYPPLYSLMDSYRKQSDVVVKLTRSDNVFYYYEVIDTNTDTDMDTDINTDTDIDTNTDSELGVSEGVSEGVTQGVSGGVSEGVSKSTYR